MAFLRSLNPKAISLWDINESAAVLWTPWHRVEVFNAIRQAERLGFLAESSSVIRALEKEIRFGYWPHVDFSWTDTARLPVWKGKNAQHA